MGPQRNDSPLLLGVLYAKAELDAAVRASPESGSGRHLTQFLAGYGSFLASPDDQTRLRLLTLRLIRTALESTVDDEGDPLARAAGDAAMAAAHLMNAHRLRRDHAPASSVATALEAARQALQAIDPNPQTPRDTSQ
ncbi:hypothetical protein [Streptomyces violaceorubidus]